MITLREKVKRQKCWHDVTVVLSIMVLVAFAGNSFMDHLFGAFQFVSHSSPQNEVSYRIESGDTLWTLASTMLEPGEDIRNKIITIRKINGLTPNQSLIPGQIVRIPVKSTNDPGFRYAMKERR